MDEFKHGENIEVSHGGVTWQGHYKYGCPHICCQGYHIVFSTKTANVVEYKYIRRPLPDLKIDDKVWGYITEWYQYHFAGWCEETGKMLVYGYGKSSWTAGNDGIKLVICRYSLTDPESK
jgi:hypothetical protein